MSTTYENDVVSWSVEQARLLRAGRFDLLDIQHIAEEIEDVGKSEQRELSSRMAVLLAHLLKWQYQADRRGASWELTIREQRRAIARRLDKTPGLKVSLNDPDWWSDAWLDARLTAEKETGISLDHFQEHCPWSQAEIFDEGWKPDC